MHFDSLQNMQRISFAVCSFLLYFHFFILLFFSSLFSVWYLQNRSFVHYIHIAFVLFFFLFKTGALIQQLIIGRTFLQPTRSLFAASKMKLKDIYWREFVGKWQKKTIDFFSLLFFMAKKNRISNIFLLVNIWNLILQVLRIGNENRI